MTAGPRSRTATAENLDGGAAGGAGASTTAKPAAPWFSARDLLRSRLSHHQAASLGDAFARFAPLGLQRACERRFDFPVAEVIRSAPLLLIRVPKTASVSLALQVYGQVAHVPHRSAAFYRDADPAFFARSTSFAVLRDPWDRAVSAYRWLRGRGNGLAAPDRRGRASAAGSHSFERFVFDVLEPAAADGHLRQLDPVLHPQRDYVCDAAGRVIVSRLFRLERMEAVQAFLAEHGISEPEVHTNASSRERGEDAPASPDLVAAVDRIYADDAALIAREFDAPPRHR